MSWYKEMLRGCRDNAAYEGGRYVILAVLAAIWPTINGILHVFWNKPWYWKLNGALIVLTVVLFIIALWKLVRIGKSQRISYEEQVNKRTTISNIPVECGPNVKGSVVKANGFTFYRARIEPTGNQQFPNLIAKLHSIKRDGVEMDLQEVLQIKYYPGDGSAPCARKNDPAFLDVVYVNPVAVADLHVHFWPAGMTHWNFESGHNYQLDIAILSAEISRRCEFEFVWTGDANTSSCRLISQGKISDDDVQITQCREKQREEALDKSVVLLKKHYPFMLSLHAIYRAKAYELKSNDDLCWICTQLVKAGHHDPFCNFQAFVPDSERLEFIKWARRQHGIDLSVGNSCLTAVQSWPEHKGRSQPTIYRQESVAVGAAWDLAGKEDWMNQLPRYDD
jgi:hypothetical protein